MGNNIIEQVSKLTKAEQAEVENLIKKLLNNHQKDETKSLYEKRKQNIGRLKGKIWMADDFNETPEDFKDYI